jgi:hypothetical protein
MSRFQKFCNTNLRLPNKISTYFALVQVIDERLTNLVARINVYLSKLDHVVPEPVKTRELPNATLGGSARN